MSLESGHRLAHYEILELVGKGGMGEVYRARDTKLGRDVAIKVLTDALSQDKERLDRFEREARLLAQLNHTNIATLHGLEEHDGNWVGFWADGKLKKVPIEGGVARGLCDLP